MNIFRKLRVILLFSLFFPLAVFGSTVGNTTNSGTAQTAPNYMGSSMITMPEDGDASSISVYFTTAAASPGNQFQVAIYTDAGGRPGSLVVSTPSQTITANSWNSVQLSTHLTSGTSYWIAVNTNGASYIPTSAGTGYFRAQTYGTWPSTYGSGTTSALAGAVYLTYTPTQSSPSPTPVADTQAPTTPTGLSASVQSTSQINLSWQASIDDTAVTGYRVYRNGTQVTSTSVTSYADIGLSSGTSYSYTVFAFDESGNVSSESSSVSASTLIPNQVPTSPSTSVESWTPPVGIPYPGDWFLKTTGTIQSIVSGGTNVTFTGTGTADAPLIFRGTGQVFTGVVTISGTYVIVENIVVTNGGVVRLTGDHVELRNSEVMNNNRSISSLTVSVGGSSNSVLYKNKIHDNGSWQGTTEADVHGIGGAGVTSNVWIIENELYHHGGDSIQFGHNGGNLVSNVYIGRNTMHHDRENAVDIKEASNFVVSENTMYGYRSTSSSEGAAVVVHYCPLNAHIINNNIYDSQVGISSTSLNTACSGQIATVRFMGNVIHDILGNGIQGWGSGKITNIVGNTLYNIGGTGMDITNASAGSSIQNNIFSNITGTDIVVAGGNVTASNNLADTTNALFVNASSGDFHLQANSPAVNTGTISNVYSAYQNLFGVSASYDRDATYRPQDSVWDIGAYEYTGSVISAPPVTETPTEPVVPIVTPSSKFTLNDRITTTATTLNIRQTPSTSGSIAGSQVLGAVGTIVGGPTLANGYYWWQVNFDTGADGWAVEDYMIKYAAPVINENSSGGNNGGTETPVVTTPIITPVTTIAGGGTTNTSGTPQILSQDQKILSIQAQLLDLMTRVAADKYLVNISAYFSELQSIGQSLALLQQESAAGTSFTKDLDLGMHDPQVTLLQDTLRRLGYFSGESTGGYFLMTQAAVRAFQRANGLEAVGVVGPKTRALLNSLK